MTLAKKMSKELWIPWISADTLQWIAFAYLSDEERISKFPSREMKWENNDEKYWLHTTQEIIDAYVEQWKTSYPAVKMMVETYQVDEDSIIIEWYQITPELVNQIEKKYWTVHKIFLTRSDKEAFVSDIPKSSTPNDRIIRKTKDPDTYRKIAKMVAIYSSYFEQEAQKYKYRILSMDTNFEVKLDKAISFLTG